MLDVKTLSSQRSSENRSQDSMTYESIWGTQKNPKNPEASSQITPNSITHNQGKKAPSTPMIPIKVFGYGRDADAEGQGLQISRRVSSSQPRELIASKGFVKVPDDFDLMRKATPLRDSQGSVLSSAGVNTMPLKNATPIGSGLTASPSNPRNGGSTEEVPGLQMTDKRDNPTSQPNRIKWGETITTNHIVDKRTGQELQLSNTPGFLEIDEEIAQVK